MVDTSSILYLFIRLIGVKYAVVFVPKLQVGKFFLSDRRKEVIIYTFRGNI
ncbi:hypothetical protein [Nostoc commune]|uniref:hypothetical protein n=1 Tax=Nostoc commune TaxID=1178 RepID=UPI002072AA84|nr:hypothetical protein [Nostoc commune]